MKTDHYVDKSVNTTEGECKICHPTCKTCSSGDEFCTLCIDKFSKYGGKCIDCSLKSDHYVDKSINTIEGECKICHSSCATCTNGTETGCVTCAVGKYRLGDKCVDCNMNKYFKNDTT